jgi:hypothetical protein
MAAMLRSACTGECCDADIVRFENAKTAQAHLAGICGGNAILMLADLSSPTHRRRDADTVVSSFARFAALLMRMERNKRSMLGVRMKQLYRAMYAHDVRRGDT